MGTTDRPLGPGSQQLNQSQTVVTSASGSTATFTFPSPPAGMTWTGTLWCANAPTGAVFIATIGPQSWGEWGGNSVYGPVQAFGTGSQQLVVTATGLASSTSYTLNWVGSSDNESLVGPVFPDANSTALTAAISGTVGLTPGTTVGLASGTSVGLASGSTVGLSSGSTVGLASGSTVGISGSVSTTGGATTVSGAGFNGASTSITVVSTGSFPASGLISVPSSGGTLIFAYTGVNATQFTGLSLLAGVSTWTITNGAPVVSAVANTGQVVTNPNAPVLDQILTSSGSAFSSLGTLLVNSTLTQSYGSFMFIMGAGINSLQNVGLAVTLSNATTGESWTLSQYITSSTDAPEFHFPIAVSAGQVLSVQVVCTGLNGSTTIYGAGFTGASTSITVASTASFASSGFISIPTLGAYGNILTFAYTGTTGTTFTGLTLISGTRTWTIPNTAPVQQAIVDEWQVVGYRDQHRLTLANNALDVLHMNQYGGVLNVNYPTVTAGQPATGATAPTGYLLRLHQWGVYQPTSATIAGSAVLASPNFPSITQAIYGAIPMLYGTAGTNAGSQTLDGLLVPSFNFYNFTNKTLVFSCNYDIVQAPTIL